MSNLDPKVIVGLITLFTSTVLFTQTPANAENKRVTVIAASSLSRYMSELGDNFERENPGTKITFSFLSSSTAARQIQEGISADIFISASTFDMYKVRNKVIRPLNYVRNQIVLGVDRKSKAHIGKFSDLNARGVRWIACVVAAPCGDITSKSLKALGTVTSKPASYEANVSSVVAKLLIHEADAGFIYYTDMKDNSTNLRGIRFKSAIPTSTVYQIALLKRSTGNSSATAFYDYLMTPETLKFLLGHGFNRP